jgi:hypothetical protein
LSADQLRLFAQELGGHGGGRFQTGRRSSTRLRQRR